MGVRTARSLLDNFRTILGIGPRAFASQRHDLHRLRLALRHQSLSWMAFCLRCGDVHKEECVRDHAQWRDGRILDVGSRRGGGCERGRECERKYLHRIRKWRFRFIESPSGSGRHDNEALHHTNQILTLLDYFTPQNQLALDGSDLDLGSGGVLLLPDQPGSFPHILVEAGKEGRIYVVNRDQMTTNNSHYCSRRMPERPGNHCWRTWKRQER